ncbi:MFS transporter, YNFM family, putative membrane transport protein [Geodermatophilus amargosae]|uniref:MFS transporter, YNFM family, putative membrane transport protein n=1 Tax=Geodermatophilus amargosae TaxID=1296565 RepID=A0A1I7AAP2_9ACTN|nr:MFS transporter [Geodermatophilus amargosae]SFT72001.1 MFS transporter, YNFM family, putative membrane transport protein [Geodermatophilus amargosae]
MPALSDPGEGPLPRGHRAGDPALRRASWAVFLAGLAVFAILYAPQALLPELTRAFAVSPAAATLSVSVATAGLALGLLVLGPLSDRIGRTSVLRAALAGSSGLAVLTAAAPAWEVLLALRGLQGFALAGLPAVGVAYLREELDASVSSRAIGLFVGGTAIGGLSGRVVAGALADLGGWRAALGGIAGLAVACTVAVWVLLPASRRFVPVPRQTPVLRQLARGLGDPVLLGLYALAALLMGGFVAVYNAGTFRLEAEPYGLSPTLAGLVFLTYLLGSVASPVAGDLAERAGRRVVVPVGLVLTAAGLALTLAAPLALFVAGLAVLTVGFFAAHGVASGWVAARAALGERPVGQAASLYSFWYYVGSSVGGTLAGRAWAAAGWPGAVAVAGTGIGGALVLALLLGRSASLGRG